MPGLTFTQPVMLWGLLAAALPVIIHLINRHRARKRPFAAIDFLFRVQRRSARRILLRQILLLAIRTLVIIALVMAAAGPVLQPEVDSRTKGPTSTVLVLDTSLSMQAQGEDASRFEVAVRLAKEHVQSMPPGDVACLVEAGQNIRVLVEPCTGTPAALLDALDNAKPAWGKSDLTRAMETSAGLLRNAPGPNRQIVLLTDAALHAFPGTPNWPLDTPRPLVHLLDTGLDQDRDNHAVTSVSQAPAGLYVELSSRLVHHGQEAVADLPIEVGLGTETISRGFVDLQPHKPALKLFSVKVPYSEGELGWIGTDADILEADDRLPFFAASRRNVSALLVNGDMRPVLHRDELFYLEHALSPSGPLGGGIRFTTITPDRLHEGLLRSIQVVFLANVRSLNPKAYGLVEAFVAAGGGLFIAVGDKLDVDRTNQSMETLLPWVLRDVVSLGPADPDGVHRSGLPFAEFDGDHPALAIFTGERARALGSVNTNRAVVLEPGRAGAGSKVLIRYSNGAPALVEGKYKAGRVMLFTSSLDRDWTNWPARASFLPFLQHATSYLAGRLDERPPPEVVVGGTVRIPLLENADRITVRPPGGRDVQLQAGSFHNGHAVYTDSKKPGWYPVEQSVEGKVVSGRSIPGFFVRLPESESDLTPVAAKDLQQLLGEGTHLHYGGTGGASARSRAWLFLLLALGLVLCEAFLIRR